MALLELFDTRYFDFTAKHFPFLGEAGGRSRGHAELQLGPSDVAGARPGEAGGAAWGAPAHAAAGLWISG